MLNADRTAATRPEKVGFKLVLYTALFCLYCHVCAIHVVSPVVSGVILYSLWCDHGLSSFTERAFERGLVAQRGFDFVISNLFVRSNATAANDI